MAQAVFSNALPRASVRSAGLNALVGRPPEPAAQGLMAVRGLDISDHRAQQITRDLCQQADIILVMGQEQRRALGSLYPFVPGKVFRIGEFSGLDVPDPYRQSMEMFEEALRIIDICASGWIERMKRIER
jgi:protein-tyrosine phosphatase